MLSSMQIKQTSVPHAWPPVAHVQKHADLLEQHAGWTARPCSLCLTSSRLNSTPALAAPKSSVTAGQGKGLKDTRTSAGLVELLLLLLLGVLPELGLGLLLLLLVRLWVGPAPAV